MYWEAKDTNAFGQVTEADLIDGAITSRRVYDAVTGRLKTAQAGPGLSTTLQDQAYLWNEVGSLTERSDALIDRRETFDYDDLHRLERVDLYVSNVLQPDPLVLAYDPMGNVTSRSDVGSGGTWTYHATKKHAVTDADGLSFSYDANGNQVLRGSDPITWSSFNYPTEIENGTARSHRYWYDGNRERWKQEYELNGVTETTIYVSGLYEKNVHSTDTEHRHYIKAGGQAIGLHIVRENGSDYHRYFLYDHQGSIATVLDGLGGLSFRESFDAFGARRNAATWQGPPSGTEWAEIATTTDQGYTGHHNLQASPLIHMRGRVMDSLTGRFLSADPYVPEPGNTQAFNRYSYVLNSPLSYTDPSGFVFELADVIQLPGPVGWIITGISVLDRLFGRRSVAPPPPNYCSLAGGGACKGPGTSRFEQIVRDIFGLPGQRFEDMIWAGCRYCMNIQDARQGIWSAARDGADTAFKILVIDYEDPLFGNIYIEAITAIPIFKPLKLGKLFKWNRVRDVPDGTTRGYRAVSNAELEDIAENGFRPHPGGRSMEDKWFSESREGAEAFRNKYDDLDNIVEADVPNDVLRRSHRDPNIDGTGPGFAVRPEDQPLVRPRTGN